MAKHNSVCQARHYYANTYAGEVQDPAFIDFAKAYFRYQQGHHPTGTKNESKALRAIEAALIQVNGNANIDGLSISVLDEASELARQHYSDGAAYHCGREIERLAKFVVENRLVSSAVQNWVNPIRRAEDKNKTGREAKKIGKRNYRVIFPSTRCGNFCKRSNG